MIRKLGIYVIRGKRFIATGNKRGILYEFRCCSNLKNKVYYPPEIPKVIYEGNTSAYLLK